MTSYLDQILAAKRPEVARSREAVPLEEVEAAAAAAPPPLNLSGALMGGGLRLIAEVKRASPSRGVLRAGLDAGALAATYAACGAAAVSVLTDPRFHGSLADLASARAALASTGTPLLRKDFLLEPYQLFEARAHGADAVLLIVAALSNQGLAEMLSAARSLWLQCLVEVHDAAELEAALEAGAEVVGINNRDLRTFHTDLAVTEALAPRVPRGRVVVSESGISGPEQMERLRRLRVHAALVGEALVTAPDPGARLRELLAPPAGGHGVRP